MGGKVTSVQVAERAGVSRSAVSRVFTPGASVSSRTAEKVRLAASELGYRPNVLARAVKAGQSKIVGLVVAYLENQFYPDAIEKLSRRLQAEGYHALVFLAANTGAETDQVIAELLDYQVDAIIAASVSMSTDLTARVTSWKEKRLPSAVIFPWSAMRPPPSKMARPDSFPRRFA